MYVFLTVTVYLFHEKIEKSKKCLIPDKFELGIWGGNITKGNAKCSVFMSNRL